MDNMLAGTALETDPSFVAIDKAIDTRIQDVPLETLIVMLVDLVHVSALPWLAEQFGVTGDRGWNLATTEQQQRNLIKNAIGLYRTRGTPYSVRAALAAIGFGNCIIREGVAIFYDGQFTHNGTQDYGGNAPFNYMVQLGPDRVPTAPELDLIERLVKEYAPVRANLVAIVVP